MFICWLAWLDSLFIIMALLFFISLGVRGPCSRMAVKEATLFVSSRDGRYDATLYRVLEDQHLPADTAFECLLSLPATEYQTAQKISYQPGKINHPDDFQLNQSINIAHYSSALLSLDICCRLFDICTMLLTWARNSQFPIWFDGLSPGASTAGAIAPPDNHIEEERPHTWMGSGGGTSIPSVSAPHRSLDSVVSPTEEQILQDVSQSTDMWQSGTGRGIRAHETNAGIYTTNFYLTKINCQNALLTRIYLRCMNLPPAYLIL